MRPHALQKQENHHVNPEWCERYRETCILRIGIRDNSGTTFMDRWQRLVADGCWSVSQMLSIKSHHPFFFHHPFFNVTKWIIYHLFSKRLFYYIKFKVHFFFHFYNHTAFPYFCCSFHCTETIREVKQERNKLPKDILHLSLFGISEQQNTADPETQKCNNKAVEFLEKQWYQQSKITHCIENWVAHILYPTPPLSSLPIRNIGWVKTESQISYNRKTPALSTIPST